VVITPTPAPAPPVASQVQSQSVSGTTGAVQAGVEQWRSLVCSYPWPCEEALNVIAHESGGDPNAVSGSGCVGLFQLCPAQSGDADPATNVARAYAKWVAGGGSFGPSWYAFWG
jgi:hypothetical protein